MTTHALELALHDLSCKKSARTTFAEDPAFFLSRYNLDEMEVAMVRDFDIRTLQQRGVSPLLTLGFWMLNAPQKSRTAYLARLRQVHSGS